MIKGYNTARVGRNSPTLELPHILQVWMIQVTTRLKIRKPSRGIASCQVYREPLEVGQRTVSQGTLMGGTEPRGGLGLLAGLESQKSCLSFLPPPSSL
jgi:hypothetical protein